MQALSMVAPKSILSHARPKRPKGQPTCMRRQSIIWPEKTHPVDPMIPGERGCHIYPEAPGWVQACITLNQQPDNQD